MCKINVRYVRIIEKKELFSHRRNRYSPTSPFKIKLITVQILELFRTQSK